MMIRIAIILISILLLSVFCVASTKTLKSINNMNIISNAMYYKLPIDKKIKYLFKNTRFIKK